MESGLCVIIDNIAKRYGLLPSEVLIRATTFDLVIMDTVMSLEKHAQESSKEGYIPPVTTEDLLKLKESV